MMKNMEYVRFYKPSENYQVMVQQLTEDVDLLPFNVKFIQTNYWNELAHDGLYVKFILVLNGHKKVFERLLTYDLQNTQYIISKDLDGNIIGKLSWQRYGKGGFLQLMTGDNLKPCNINAIFGIHEIQ